MNVFDLALSMEKEAWAHYERLATEAGSWEMKSLYSLLADSEREHYERLMVMKQGTGGDAAKSVALDRIKNRLPEIVGSINRGGHLGRGDDGYRGVIRAEESSIRLYEKLAEKETNPEAASLLRQLAEEERHHLHVIENIYEFTEAPRTFLASGEFSNLHDL